MRAGGIDAAPLRPPRTPPRRAEVAPGGPLCHPIVRMISRRWLSALGLAIALGAAACGGDGTSGDAAPPPPPPSADSCPEGFALDAALGACTEILPAAECAPGTMPEIGKRECQPVGWTGACPEGFVRDATGFACLDKLAPRVACTGATREDVKTGTCVPVGDCNAPFPPPAATIFVDDDGPTDATHFNSLGAAMALAPEGAVIAVEAGTYKEDVRLTIDKATVIGRCAEKVRFESPGGPRAGLYVKGSTGGTVRNVTVTGFRGGVLMEGGDVTIEDSLIDANNTLGVYLRFGAKVTMRRSRLSNTVLGDDLGSGIVVYDGSALTLEDMAVVDNYFRHATVDGKGSTLNATSTVFARNTKLSGSDEEVAISVEDGAAAKLVKSAVVDSLHAGVTVTGEGSTVELHESVIRRVSGKLKTSGGVGLTAFKGGVAKLVSSAITDIPVVGAYGDGGGLVVVLGSTILGSPPGAAVEFGRCASASKGGRLQFKDAAVIGCPQSGVGLQEEAFGTFDRLYVRDARPIKESIGDYGGFGLLVEKGSKATVTRSSFVGNTLAGITSNNGSEVEAEAVLVQGTRPIPGLTPGSALQIAVNGKLTMTRSALVANTTETAIVTMGGALSLARSTVHGTTRDHDGQFGHGIAVFPDATVTLDDVAVYDSPAVGLVSDGGRAFVRGGVFARNAVALHAQNGASVTQSDAAESLGGSELRVSTTTRFVENGARVGNGIIAVPQAPIQ